MGMYVFVIIITTKKMENMFAIHAILHAINVMEIIITRVQTAINLQRIESQVDVLAFVILDIMKFKTNQYVKAVIIHVCFAVVPMPINVNNVLKMINENSIHIYLHALARILILIMELVSANFVIHHVKVATKWERMDVQLASRR